MQPELFFYFFFPAGLLYLAGDQCAVLEARSRGKGSWYKDRELLGLRGAFWALSLVYLALSIACILA